MNPTDKKDLNKVVKALEVLSDVVRQRHFTVFAFSSGYKVVLGTPSLAWGPDETGDGTSGDLGLVSSLEQHPTMAEAILDVIKNRQEF